MFAFVDEFLRYLMYFVDMVEYLVMDCRGMIEKVDYGSRFSRLFYSRNEIRITCDEYGMLDLARIAEVDDI